MRSLGRPHHCAAARLLQDADAADDAVAGQTHSLADAPAGRLWCANSQIHMEASEHTLFALKSC